MSREIQVTSTLSNCTSSLPDGTYPDTQVTIILTANNGFYFDIVPKIGGWTEGEYLYRNFEKQSDTVYTLTTDFNDFSPYGTKGRMKVYKVEMQAEASKKTVIKDKYGLISVFNPTIDELNELMKKRFMSPSSGSTFLDYVDTAQYLINFMKLYVDVNTEEKEDVYFGPYNTNVKCNLVEDDIIEVDCGNCYIHEKYQNKLDYESEIEMYIPFVGFVELSPNEFMNRRVSLKYQVNVLNGESLAILSSDGDVRQTHSCNVGFKIPYILQAGNDTFQPATVNKDLQPNTNYLNDTPPIIYVKTPIPTNPEHYPYNTTSFYAVLGTLNGYTEVDELDFVVIHDTITQTEIEEIESLLSGGVFL